MLFTLRKKSNFVLHKNKLDYGEMQAKTWIKQLAVACFLLTVFLVSQYCSKLQKWYIFFRKKCIFGKKIRKQWKS